MINTPAIKLMVLNPYLNQKDTDIDITECYLLSVDCRPNDIIRFTVLLISGAVWSGLPIEALISFKYDQTERYLNKKLLTNNLQPFTCLEGPYTINSYDLLKNAELEVKVGGHTMTAYYQFTINYEGQGLAEDPEQYKTHNIVVLENGQLAALPNNYIKVKSNWFSDPNKGTENYKRSSKHYFAGG